MPMKSTLILLSLGMRVQVRPRACLPAVSRTDVVPAGVDAATQHIPKVALERVARLSPVIARERQCRLDGADGIAGDSPLEQAQLGHGRWPAAIDVGAGAGQQPRVDGEPALDLPDHALDARQAA